MKILTCIVHIFWYLCPAFLIFCCSLSFKINTTYGEQRLDLVRPVVTQYQISQPFGPSSDSDLQEDYKDLGYEGHFGIDYKCPVGTDIFACDGGDVVETSDSNPKRYNGLYVRIKHKWGSSVYLHLSKVKVKNGERVEKHKVIGYSGQTGFVTGPHLHFGMRISGITNQGFKDYVDPQKYASFESPVTQLTITTKTNVGLKLETSVQGTEKFSYTISLKPSSTYELFVPIMKRSAENHSSRTLGVFNKRDMWYNVKIFERSHGQHAWKMRSPEAIILKPTTEGEITETFDIAEGKDFKFEVSNDLNDPRLLALWCTDFISRALVGKRMSWDDPTAVTEAVAFFTTFMSPNLQEFGLGLGLGVDFFSNPKRSVQRIAKAILKSKTSQAALARVLAAGGLPVTAAHLTALAAIVVGNAMINAPAWWELFQNINREPHIEEVIFQTSRRLMVEDVEKDLTLSHQIYEKVGATWIYKLTVYDERHNRLSHGRLIAINDGVVGFGGVQAIQFSRRLELDPPISGWGRYYRDPISDGGSYYSILEDRILALGGWTTGRVTTRWMLDPPATIGSLAPDEEYHYEGTIEYFDGIRERHAPTTIRVRGRETVEVPAGIYSAIRISSTSVNVLHYDSIFCDVWRLPKTGAVKIMERSPLNYWWEAELIRIIIKK